jgi:hypothetical protein
MTTPKNRDLQDVEATNAANQTQVAGSQNAFNNFQELLKDANKINDLDNNSLENPQIRIQDATFGL